VGYAFASFLILSRHRRAVYCNHHTANGQTVERVAEMIVIANSKKYGTGVINPSGIMNDGKFELVVLKNIDLTIFAKIITGNIPLESEM
jgi:hypothetical protein